MADEDDVPLSDFTVAGWSTEVIEDAVQSQVQISLHAFLGHLASETLC